MLLRRVVIVADSVVPRLGMEKALLALLSELPPDRVKLVVISGPPPESGPHQVITLNQRSGWRGRLRALPALRGIAKESARSGEALVSTGSWAFIAMAIATLCTPAKVTLWEHTLLPWRLRHEPRIALIGFLLRILSFRLENVVCVSESNRVTVGRLVWPLRSLHVIPNIVVQSSAVSFEEDFAVGVGETVRILGIGSLDRRKNWQLAIRAMEHLPENFRLEIAGKGSDHNRLSKLIKRLGLTARVQLLGYIPEADRLIESVDIIVHPSLAETFGYTLVEAASRNRPIVVLDRPAMNEMVPVFVCGRTAGSSPEAFAEAVRKVSGEVYDFPAASTSREKKFSAAAVAPKWSVVLAEPRG